MLRTQTAGGMSPQLMEVAKVKTIAKTWRDQLREVASAYREAGQSWPSTAMNIAIWGFNEGLLKSHRGSMLKYYAKEISRSLREEYYTDPQGRAVRTNHVAPGLVDGEQKMLWDDIRSAPPEHMEKALKLRRNQIVGDCSQLKRDMDSYNENNVHGCRLQL